ncbi:hypothetical protein NE237_008532 [Protea cynaroides]|uniref:Uncharacterized protein n=1 Tax=Protea cynaroides TaxID=273540 RepID=A0A9Q0KVS4_9MAGN|nr:hypothetical protein NE237_008532 [Protea cynaroides]
MIALSKLATGLTVVFVVCLLLLLAQVSYIFCYRRRFRRQNASVESEAAGVAYTSNTNNSFTSKELLYLFCWNYQSRVEPASAPTAPPTDEEDPFSESESSLKQAVLYGQSRLLFTIKEEEREDLESEKSSSAERKSNTDQKRVSLNDCFEKTLEEPAVDTGEVEVEVEVGLEREGTPFSTPCASPPYYTPSPSPTRVDGGDQGGCFVSLQVHGG